VLTLKLEPRGFDWKKSRLTNLGYSTDDISLLLYSEKNRSSMGVKSQRPQTAKSSRRKNILLKN